MASWSRTVPYAGGNPMETVTAWNWSRVIGAPDWLAEGLELAARQLAQAGELRSPAVWRCDTPDGTTWWATDQPQPHGGTFVSFYTPESATLTDVLTQLGARWPGGWMLSTIGIGGTLSGSAPVRIVWGFSGFALPVVRLDA